MSEILNNNVNAEAVHNEAQPKQSRRKKVSAKPKKEVKTQTPPQFADKFTYEGNLLFKKYSYAVSVDDLSLKNYVDLKPLAFPSTFRRSSSKMFSKANINIVERLENALMRGGTGKKIGGHVIRTKGNLIVFIYMIYGPVSRYECTYDLSILYELNPYALYLP